MTALDHQLPASPSTEPAGPTPAPTLSLEPAPSPVIAPAEVPSPGEVPRPAEMDAELRHVSVLSAARLVGGFALVTVAVWSVALLLFWVVGTGLGFTDRFQGFVRDLGVQGFHLASTPVLIGVAIAGLAWIVSWVVLAVLAAVAYNVFAAGFGGLRIRVVVIDHDSTASAPA